MLILCQPFITEARGTNRETVITAQCSGQHSALWPTTVSDDTDVEKDKSKSVTDGAGIKTISSVNFVQEWKKSKTAEAKRRGSSGSSRRKRYETDRV